MNRFIPAVASLILAACGTSISYAQQANSPAILGAGKSPMDAAKTPTMIRPGLPPLEFFQACDGKHPGDKVSLNLGGAPITGECVELPSKLIMLPPPMPMPSARKQ